MWREKLTKQFWTRVEWLMLQPIISLTIKRTCSSYIRKIRFNLDFIQFFSSNWMSGNYYGLYNKSSIHRAAPSQCDKLKNTLVKWAIEAVIIKSFPLELCQFICREPSEVGTLIKRSWCQLKLKNWNGFPLTPIFEHCRVIVEYVMRRHEPCSLIYPQSINDRNGIGSKLILR